MPGNAPDLIDTLVGDLKPVRRTRPWRDAAILVGLGLVEAAVYFSMGGMRPDMPMAMTDPALWWKAASLALLTAVAGATALGSLNPAASPRRGLRRVAAIATIILGIGWGIDAASGGVAALLARLDWHHGIDCVFAVVTLSLPALVALGVLMRRGAPTDLRGTALAVGLTASAWGGLVFVLACPHDDPLYIAVWFAVAIGIVALAARLILPRLVRW